MILKKTSVVLLVVALLAQAEMTWAQQSNIPISEAWRAVTSMPTGSDLIVKLKSGKTIKGNNISTSDVVIRLSEGKKIFEIGRDDVGRIHLIVPRKSHEKAEAIGAAVGTAFGAWLAFAGSESGSPPASVVVLVALAFGGIGYKLGQLFSPKYKRVLIYEAKK